MGDSSMKRQLWIGIPVTIIMLTFASIAAAQGGNLPAGSYQLVLVNGVVHPSTFIAAKIKSVVTNASESRGGSVPEGMGRGNFGDLRARIGQVGTQFDSLVRNGMLVIMADMRGALARQAISEAGIKDGDALLSNHDWLKLWKDPNTYNTNPPGNGIPTLENMALYSMTADELYESDNIYTPNPFGDVIPSPDR